MTTKTAAAKATSIYKAGQLYQVQPGQLVLERNIRDAQPDAELLASVTALGVLQPITAVIGADGRLVVRLGHRRTLAALKAKRPTVPVYVVDVDDTTDAGEISRIVSQRDENTLRAGLTAGDDLGVVEQLTLLGLSADEIVEQARIGKDQVDTALRVTKSKIAKRSAEKYSELTLDQAATVAEFEDDDATVKVLVAAAVKEPATFEHVAQRARDERIRAEYRDEVLAGLARAGVKVVKQPDWSDKTKRLHQLRDDKGKEITPEQHADCKGHVAWLYSEWMWIDPEGNVVGRPQDGYRQIQLDTARYGCSDPKKHGHRDTHSSSASRATTADLSPAEREKAKEQRRLVIENNQAWDAATVVRRSWLKTFAGCKSAPKGAAAFLATALVSDQGVITHYKAADVTREVFGIKNTGYRSIEAHIVKELKGASEGRSLVLALLPVLGAYESMADRSAWRQDGTQSHAGRYLRFLAACGYGLSDVEKFAISSKRVS